MKDINKIHEAVFTVLNDWSQGERTYRHSVETVRDEINPYFYMRSIRDERFKKGYWFPGNDNYICISFWAGGDSLNKTPNIYFELNEKLGCRIIISAKDSIAKRNYFENLVKIINKQASGDKGFVKGKSVGIWIKHLDSPFTNWHEELGKFVTREKKIIDSFILRNELIESEEFVTNFGMISSTDFEKMLSRVLKERDIIEEQKMIPADSLVRSSKKHLPLSLLSITVENFQGIIKAKLSKLRPDARWIFITGENGYGKTTILQSIAMGLSSEKRIDDYLNDDTRIALEVLINGDKTFLSRSKASYPKYNFPVVGYGPARLNIQSRASENIEDKSFSPVISLFDNETLLKNINYELFASNYSDKKTFLELENIIKIVTNGRINSIKVDKREVFFFEKLNNGEILEPLPLSKLAAGFRSIINVVIDIYLRFRDYHYDKKYRDFYGIVLIDEIENHLHPVLQRELPITLSKVFPKIQFVVSTHSPIPLLAAEKNSVIITVNRNLKDGVCMERLDEIIDFPSLLPNTILTSPIFGFENIFPENKKDAKFIRSEKTYSEIVSNNKQSQIIENHLTDETTTEILKLLKKD